MDGAALSFDQDGAARHDRAALSVLDVLEAVLAAYALIAHRRGRHGPDDLVALLHRPAHVAHAQRELVGLFRDLLAEAAEAGALRDDAVPDELARYCLHALSAAGGLPSEAAVGRLVAVTLAGLRPAR